MTLIELLVSLAIIGLLTAVALPVFSTYQRQNALNLGVKNLEQLFYYSRALNNNPSYSSRNYSEEIANANKRYGIKIKPTGSGKKAVLYPAENVGDDSRAIDTVVFDPRTTFEFTDGTGRVITGDVIVYISADPPNEVVSCNNEAVYTELVPPQPDCSVALFIKIAIAGVSAPKTISIYSTNDAIRQKFNIRVN